MSTSAKEAAAPTSAEHKRWLIGIGISVLFGVFGMVMALLAYADRTKAAATAPASAAPAAPTAPAERPDGKGRGKGRGRD